MGIDSDAYTTNCIAHANVIEYCEYQGIFVEENAADNTVTSNVVRYNGRNGIALYSNIEGPVSGNLIVGNTVHDNTLSGISVGGNKTDPTINFAQDNSIVGNEAWNNGRGLWVNQYDNLLGLNDYWVSKEEVGTTPTKWFGQDGAAFPDGAPFPTNATVVAMLDPDLPSSNAPSAPPSNAPSVATTSCPICAPTGQECCGTCIDGGRPSGRGCFA